MNAAGVMAGRWTRCVVVAGLLGLGAVLPGGAVRAQAVGADPGSPTVPEGLRERLMHDLGVLAHDSMGGRAPGSEGAERARVHLRRRLQALGLEVREDTFTVRRRSGDAPMGVNLRVSVPGLSLPEKALVLTAHYDHLGTRDGVVYNGADDNASGTAALLELARDLVASPPEHTMVLLFLDAEEGGLQGARHYVADPAVPLAATVAAVNLDMVAHADSVLWVAGTWPWPGLRPMVEAVRPSPPVQLRFGHDTPQDTGADDWVGASDHAAFHAEGIPFVYFGVADHPDYHRPTDDVERIDAGFFAAAVETIRRVVRTLDAELRGVRVEAR